MQKYAPVIYKFYPFVRTRTYVRNKNFVEDIPAITEMYMT
jgi:hypothetical protein